MMEDCPSIHIDYTKVSALDIPVYVVIFYTRLTFQVPFMY